MEKMNEDIKEMSQWKNKGQVDDMTTKDDIITYFV